MKKWKTANHVILNGTKCIKLSVNNKLLHSLFYRKLRPFQFPRCFYVLKMTSRGPTNFSLVYKPFITMSCIYHIFRIFQWDHLLGIDLSIYMLYSKHTYMIATKEGLDSTTRTLTNNKLYRLPSFLLRW